MATEKDIRNQKQLNKELEGKKQNLKDIEALEKKGFNSAVKRRDVEKQISDLNKESFKLTSSELGLEKQINSIKDSGLNSISKQLGLEKQITTFKDLAKKGTKEEIKNAAKLTGIIADVANGSKDFASALNDVADEDFGDLNDFAEKFAKTLQDAPDLESKLKVEAQAQQKINDFRDKISEASAFLSSPKAMGVAVIGLLVQQMVEFAQKTLEVRQNLGTSVTESARLAGNMKAAGLAAKSVGGSSEEAEAAISAMVQEFGYVNSVSNGVAIGLGKITGQFAISGANAAKLLKTMQSINGASIETNLNLISATGELARAEGVAPGHVLNDIAENTELYAQFAKKGGENIAKAAIEARKLGLNLGTVASVAESLLDFESSIEKEMEASMLLGRQLSLDKARELALTGDLAGLTEEIKNQVGSQAEFESMNVVQRKALADSIGVSVADLGRMVAGEKTSAQLAEDRLKAEKDIAKMQLIGAAAMVIAAGARMGGLPGAIAAAGIGAGLVYGLPSTVPSLQTGGDIKSSGIAEVHAGESVGNLSKVEKRLNELVVESKRLRSQNESLMNRLTDRVGGIGMSSAM